MEALRVKGGSRLHGTIEIGGAKNSAVALVPAAILSDKVVIKNVPDISDVKALKIILEYLGASYTSHGDELCIDSTLLENKPITLEYAEMLRASYYFTGALLGKYKHTEMYFPGGCTIGERPIDLHLFGFEKLGATVKYEDDRYIITADKLVGDDIDLSFASVGATINIILAAVYAEGKTVIRNAAMEPEVENVIEFVNSMGAKVKRCDDRSIEIIGVDKLSGGSVDVIPDRIEAGTYIIAGVMNGDNLKIDKVIPEHFKALTDKLLEMGANIKIGYDYVIANKTTDLKPVQVITEVYPGFPTDLQQPITTLLTMCNGESKIVEKIYENRFQNVPYLVYMGADITVTGDTLTINGPTNFRAGEVITTDLRAGAALILAALSADGVTLIKDVKYVLRGYENIINKLTKVGVKIAIEDI